MTPDTVRLALRPGDGRWLGFDVRVRGAAPAVFAMGVRKSGSTLLAKIVSALARAEGWNAVDVAGAAFDAGWAAADWCASLRLADLMWRGNAYVGFRDAPLALFADPVFREGTKLLLVRDPRDALVSEYYSSAWSHRLPPGGGRPAAERERALASGVEAYAVARADALDRTMTGYAGLLGTPGLLVQRYEDVILAKRDWIRAMAAHFGWSAQPATVDAILAWADVVPAAEDPRAFVRRVRPGDHREKLSPAGIAAVERQLSGVWRDLGYEW